MKKLLSLIILVLSIGYLVPASAFTIYNTNQGDGVGLYVTGDVGSFEQWIYPNDKTGWSMDEAINLKIHWAYYKSGQISAYDLDNYVVCHAGPQSSANLCGWKLRYNVCVQ